MLLLELYLRYAIYQQPRSFNMFASPLLLGALAIAQTAVAQQPAPTGPQTPEQIAAAAAARQLAIEADEFNQQFYNYIFIICASLIVALGLWRIIIESVKYVRTLTCLNNDTQKYFTIPNKTFATFKKHLLYAPIFRRRHNREFQLSAAVNVGTLPTRFQLIFLSLYFGTNIAFCVVSISWSSPYATVTRQLRNRTGILAVVNMVSIVLSSRHRHG